MTFFLELGVDPLTTDKIHQTPLYYAAREGKFQCSKLLVEKGCPLNDKDMYMQTPIYYAAREGRLNICELFIAHGADISVEDKFGQTCIFYAIREGHLEVVEFLIKKGAVLEKFDKKKLTPYAFAVKHNKVKIAELLASYGATAMVKSNIVEKKSAKNIKKNTAKINNDKNISMNTNPNLEESKIEIEDHQKPKQFVLIKINENGEKVALNLEELEEFKQKHEELAKLLYNEADLEECEKNAPEE